MPFGKGFKRMIVFFFIVLLLFPSLLNSSVSTPILKWQNGGYSLVEFNKAYYTSPATMDVNGDGVRDIIWANFKVFAFDGNTGSIIWWFYAGTDMSNPGIRNSIGTNCSVVIADINADGNKDIVTAHTNGMVCAYNKNGYFLPGFPTQPTGRTDVICSLSAADLDNDGDGEIIIGWGIANNLNCCVIEHNGSIRPGWPQYVPNDNANALGIFNDNIAIGDINQDGYPELVVPSDTGKTCVYYRDGTPLPVNPLFSQYVDYSKKWPDVVNYEDYDHEKFGYSPDGYFYMGTDQPATIADVNNDGTYEIIIVGQVFTKDTSTNLHTTPFIYNIDRTRFNQGNFNWEGNLPQSGPPLSNDWQEISIKRTNPVVVDIDGDGYKEILSSSYDGKLHCYWLDKTEHHNWPFSVYNPGEGVIRFSSEPVVADLDGDGGLEIIFTTWPQFYSDTGGHLFILNHEGAVVTAVPLPYGDEGDVGQNNFDGGLAAPTIDDIDGDGELEIIVGTVYAGLVVYDVAGATGGALPWPTGRHDFRRSGYVKIIKDNFLGTWSDLGSNYLDQDTDTWIKMASPATQITAGDIDHDGTDDLIGIWPSQGGVWVKYSATGQWERLGSTSDWIASGDMDGDGRTDLLGTWSSQGVFYKNSSSGYWIQMASPATQITAGDLDHDGTDDLIGIWPSQGGVWVKYSATGQWERLGSTPDWITTGDMDGDGQTDLLGTWSGQGVYYKSSSNGYWNYLASHATQITAGDIDHDGTDDLIGIWPSQDGVWIKYSSTGQWEWLQKTADWISSGKMMRDSDVMGGTNMTSEPDLLSYNIKDSSNEGPGGYNFKYIKQKNIDIRNQSGNKNKKPTKH